MKFEHSRIHLPFRLLQVYLTLPAQSKGLALPDVSILFAMDGCYRSFELQHISEDFPNARADYRKRQNAHMISNRPAMLLPLQHSC